MLYGEATFHAIEVKRSRRVRPEDLRGLRAFLQDYPEATATLLYMGEHRQKEGAITCMPCKEFLSNLLPGQPLPV